MIAASCDQPAAAEKAVVFACDGNYARFALFAAAQIDRLAPGRDFDICLCAMEPPVPAPSLEAARVRFCRIDTGGVFGAMKLDARRTEASYLRLALPAAFAGTYRRLLYLDADVFIQGGDFSRLLDLDLRGAALPLRAEARLLFRAFPPFLIRAFADYEREMTRLGKRPSGPSVDRAMLERLEIVEVARAELEVSR